jgi:hypothetical protein
VVQCSRAAESAGLSLLTLYANEPQLWFRRPAWRELARWAKRLAKGLLDGPDRDLLLQYAEELEEKAARMDSTRLEDPAKPEGAATAMGAPRSPSH